MNKPVHPMTKFGKEKIEAELDHLIKVERENLKVTIGEARALGDLKENAEYHAAKEKQSHVEGRIGELQGKLAGSRVIDPTTLSGDRIVFGATVVLYNIEKEEEVTYQIVGEDEADSKLSKISYASPIAKSLIGKEEGDEVTVRAPKGDITFEIQSVSFK
jgi:transcription elongation factor GreA